MSKLQTHILLNERVPKATQTGSWGSSEGSEEDSCVKRTQVAARFSVSRLRDVRVTSPPWLHDVRINEGQFSAEFVEAGADTGHRRWR